MFLDRKNHFLRQCQLYSNLFTYLMQFHSTGKNPKEKSLQVGRLPKNLKFTKKNKHTRAAKQVLAYRFLIFDAPTSQSSSPGIKNNSMARKMYQLISINLRWETRQFTLIHSYKAIQPSEWNFIRLKNS